MICICSLLLACGATQEMISNSSEGISKSLRQGELIKYGDWIRATTLDGESHEFSFLGISEDELQGGDTIIHLSHIKQLEVFPLLRWGEENPNPRSVVSDAVFEGRLKQRIRGGAHIVATIVLNGKEHTMWPSSVWREILDGKVLEFAEDHDAEYEINRWINRKVPLSNTLSYFECHWGFLEKKCAFNESFNRWVDAEEARIAMIQGGDW